MPRLELPGSRLRADVLPDVPSAFILECAALETLLFDRNLIGLPFTTACEAASTAFFCHFEDEFAAADSSLAEYLLLTKGMYYWLHNAYARACGRNLQANFAVTKRVIDDHGYMRIDVPYLSVDVPADTLVIGDTIASGMTMCAALEAYREHWPLRHVYIFSIVGSAVGGRMIDAFCRERGISVTIVFGLACFGLAANGFDLSFLHPDTVTAGRYVGRAQELFHGKPVSSAGWDFASQAQAEQKYRMLCALEERLWSLEGTGVFRLAADAIDQRLVAKEYAAFDQARRYTAAD